MTRLHSNTTVLGLTIAMQTAFGAFCVLRIRQLSLADPFNNRFTYWSTACLLLFLMLWISDAIAFACLKRRLGRVTVWISAIAIGIGAVPIGMLAFTVLSVLR